MGFFDTYKNETSFLITGSARLDYYRKGEDSLQGRYHYYRLHPFSLPELNPGQGNKDIETMLRYGGFPEPCLKSEERFWRRWQRERLQRVIYEDIRDLENIREISLMELLANELPSRVGSPLSVKNLKETLQVAHETVARWLKILERMYFCFRISPYGAPRIRAVKKEQKLYLWDWSQVEKKGPGLKISWPATFSNTAILLRTPRDMKWNSGFSGTQISGKWILSCSRIKNPALLLSASQDRTT